LSPSENRKNGSRPRIVVADERRRANMRAVHAKNTGLELIVRGIAHRLGLRYRLHRRDLPGRPDLTFPKWKTIIFVNGCFWHQHPGCKKATIPVTNRAFWQEKLRRNAERDHQTIERLMALGWRVLVIWECQIRDSNLVAKILSRYFRSKKRGHLAMNRIHVRQTSHARR
jgi:DNA mismatch endonuclease, patch repair protein